MRIAQVEALKMLQDDPEIRLIDVRTHDEFERGHIPGAVCIPYAVLDTKLEETFPDKTDKIMLYCQSGKKCMSLGNKLEKMGYVNVFQVGGIVTWPGEIEVDIMTLMRERHSVRRYAETPIEDDLCASIEKVIQQCNSAGDLNIQFIKNDEECFKSFLARYGKFSNVRNYLVMVGKATDADLEEKVGYYGQKLVLAAQSRGLNTCWVGGTFSKGKCKAKISPGEKLVCVIAIGHGENKGLPHTGKDMNRLCDVPEDKMPDWFKLGVEAAMLAPTAMNQQKFMISLQEGEPVISTGRGFFTRVDLGIVRYSFEAASGHEIRRI